MDNLISVGITLLLIYFSFTDLRERIIPNAWTHPILFVLGLYRLVDSPMYFIGLIPALLFVIVFYIQPKLIGAGDIKLIAILGLGVPVIVVVGILFWAALATLVVMMTQWIRRKEYSRMFPLAPFMAFGWLIMLAADFL